MADAMCDGAGSDVRDGGLVPDGCASASFASCCEDWPEGGWLTDWLVSGAVPSPGSRAEILEPANGQPLFVVPTVDEEGLSRQCHRACEAQSSWAGRTAAERAGVLDRAAVMIEEQGGTLAWLLTRETGATSSLARFQVRQAARCLRLAAALSLQPMTRELESTPVRASRALRLPMGLVAVITPFNFPLLLALRCVAPALALGNAVIIKPDPATPVSGGLVIAEILRRAGLPSHLLQVAIGAGDIGSALCRHASVSMVCFTGSTDTGRLVGELCGRHLKKAVLELGGKNALIVLDDADIEHAAALIARSCWLHQGQVCMAAGRVLVPDTMADAVIGRLVDMASGMRHGDPRDPTVRVGPIINSRQQARIASIVDASITAGAQLQCGGTQEGPFYRPTVLDHVLPGMPAYEEEIFGPVVSITRYGDEAEAIAHANRAPDGLVAAVIAADVERARQVGSRLRAGMLHLNGQTIQDDGDNPFGGFGASGNGWGMGGPCDIELYTRWCWVTSTSQSN